MVSMKTIGLIGGMSWESSALYYAAINRGIRDALGGIHSASITMHSFDFAEIAALQKAGDWDALGATLAEAAKRLEAAGADMLLVCTNTMHKLAPEIEAATSIPLLHIADPLGSAIRKAGFTRAGLLGTGFTMEQDFLKDRLSHEHGVTCLVPDDAGRAEVHRVIYEELVAGEVREESRARYCEIVDQLRADGAECIILGCTEIVMLLRQEDSSLPLFDTTALHAAAAVEAALA